MLVCNHHRCGKYNYALTPTPLRVNQIQKLIQKVSSIHLFVSIIILIIMSYFNVTCNDSWLHWLDKTISWIVQPLWLTRFGFCSAMVLCYVEWFQTHYVCLYHWNSVSNIAVGSFWYFLQLHETTGIHVNKVTVIQLICIALVVPLMYSLNISIQISNFT